MTNKECDDADEKQDEQPADESREGMRDGVSRRMFVGAAALASAGFMSAGALAQTRSELQAGRQGASSSDPGPDNHPLLEENPSSNMPPFTDKGNIGPVWQSFNLSPKRLQQGGWTRQVTERELPPSKDLAGVNMRLTAESFRELHWHSADEWAAGTAGGRPAVPGEESGDCE
jgi:oxalate decarboxylase